MVGRQQANVQSKTAALGCGDSSPLWIGSPAAGVDTLAHLSAKKAAMDRRTRKGRAVRPESLLLS
jgi:hypothetical protein